ncbi:MAG TPA: MarR family transcriptional regulator [Peptococcaceae bacterium]|nr:MAG: Transcriptional regulator, MarR family [Moorella sp. 60_41]HBT47417.1 MarR family transcriptional regulator [Peptococcaceae bacterium]
MAREVIDSVDRETARELYGLLTKFMGLYHKKFLCVLRSSGGCEARLKKNQQKLICHLFFEGEATPSELSRKVGLEKGSLTTLLDSLEKIGFIARKGDPRDRRKTLVSLTPRGRAHMEEVTARQRDIILELLKKLGRPEADELIASLKKAVDILERL